MLAIEARWFGREGLWAEQSHWLERGLGGARPVSPQTRAEALFSAGAAAYSVGELEIAAKRTEQSLHLYRQLGDDVALIRVLRNLGGLARLSGEHGRARSLLQESLRLAERLSNRRGVYRGLCWLGTLELDLGNLDVASDLFERSTALAREAGENGFLSEILEGLGYVALLKHDVARATRIYADALRLSRDLGSPVTECLAGLAAVAAVTGDAERAGRLWGAVEVLERETYWLQSDRARYQELIETCSDLAPMAFAVAADRGRTMSPDAILDYALADNG